MDLLSTVIPHSIQIMFHEEMKQRSVIKLDCVDNAGVHKDCTIEVSDDEPWVIKAEIPELEERIFQGSDLFDCLMKFRIYLESKNYLLLCNGARVDVYPSGMSRDMSGGKLAYITKLGISPSKDDLVDIFDSTSQKYIGTVEQQKEYRALWVNSIKSH